MKAPLFVFTGIKGSGKSMAAGALVDAGFVLHKFTAPLKDMLRAAGLTEREIEGDHKESPSDLLLGHTPRHAMQTLGTEWGRRMIGDDFWVSIWKHRVAHALWRKCMVVCDDCRFPNEAEAARAMGGKIILVKRDAQERDTDNHAIEIGVMSLPFDYVIHNDGTPSDLRDAVRGAVRDLWRRGDDASKDYVT